MFFHKIKFKNWIFKQSRFGILETFFKKPQILKEIAREHTENLQRGPPQLNWCDKAVMVSKV